MQSVDKLNSFSVYASFTLSNDDMNALTLLYSPLIGGNALALYFSFSALLERNNLKSTSLKHIDFLDAFGLDLKDFMKSRYALEAIGLLETYQDNNNEFIYIVKPPLTPKEFLYDGCYGVYLYSKVGEKMFNYLLDHFKIEKIDKTNFKNITVTFDDVFKSDVPENIDFNHKYGYLIGKKTGNTIKISGHHFDFDNFKSRIDMELVDKAYLSSFEKTIVNTSYVYGITEEEMTSLFIQSIGSDGFFSFKLLKKKANTFFKSENLGALAPTLKTRPSSEMEEEIERLENATAEAILRGSNVEYDINYLKTINDVYAEIELPRGVLNVMILYAIKKYSENSLPTLAYYKKMAATWIANDIVTTERALSFTYGNLNLSDDSKKNKSSNNNYQNKVQSDTPDWLLEFKQSIAKGNTNQ